MIAEDVLERALGTAAEDYDVPDGAIDRLREQLAPAVAEEPDDNAGSLHRLRMWRPTSHQWLAAGAAACVVLIGLAFALGGSGTNSGESAGGAGPARVAGLPPTASGATSRGEAQRLGGSGGGGTALSNPSPQLPAAVASPPPKSAASGGGLSFGSATGTTGSASSNDANVRSPARSLPAPGDSARVVKTGELDLQVKKGEVSHTLDRLNGLATLQGGYVANSNTSEGGDDPSGQVTMRVPVGAFEQTIGKARGYGKVMALQTSGKDVTAQYSDVQARIKALKATRSTFLSILSRATTIGDTLAVQQRITDVQTEIDQLQGRLNVLGDQSELATLTVTVDQVAKPLAVAKPHHRSGLSKAVDRSVGRFVRGVEAIIGVIGPILLVLLVVAIGWLATRFGYRVLRRRLV
jgi:hypothetical protein